MGSHYRKRRASKVRIHNDSTQRWSICCSVYRPHTYSLCLWKLLLTALYSDCPFNFFHSFIPTDISSSFFRITELLYWCKLDFNIWSKCEQCFPVQNSLLGSNKCFYSFSWLFTHIFWKHASYSQNSTHKSKNTHTMGKTPQFSCKMKLYIQNNVLSSQNGILFSNDTHKPSYE